LAASSGPTPSLVRITVARVGSVEAALLKAVTGRSMRGWRRTISNFEARKVWNKHSKPVASHPRQVPLVAADFRLIPQIQRFGQPGKYIERLPGTGPSSISTSAEIGAHRYHVVERIHPDFREMRFWLMWKEPI
jgi:hypothetical protein